MGALEVGGFQNSRSCARTMMLQLGRQWDLKRLQAARLPHKIMRANKWKSGQKSNHTGSSKRTHTTLRRCVAHHVENPQKSGVLGPRQICSGRLKALPWVQNVYGACLLLPYINNLNPRPPLPLSNAQGA
jgi:hypothetical protein